MSWIKYFLRRLWLAVSGQPRWLAGPSPADHDAIEAHAQELWASTEAAITAARGYDDLFDDEVEAHCDELWAESQAAIQAAIYWGEE